MKRLIILLIPLAVIALLPLATGQENTVERKHLFVPSTNGNRGASVSAMDIERGVDYPSVVHLKGDVEIKMPVCLRTGPDNQMVCDGYMVVRANAADMHEGTGTIEAHGDITLTQTKF